MAPGLTTDSWAQIRADYEHSDKPVAAICAEHGISDGTLRNRMRRWGWTRRRPPIPREGPPPRPASLAEPEVFDRVAHALVPAAAIESPCASAPPPTAAADTAPLPAADKGAIGPRLQSAVARVLPAIEAIVARLAAGPMPAHEMERAGRALSSLTRTLRELNGLLGQHQEHAAVVDDDPIPEDIDEFRRELARRMDAFVVARTGKTIDDTETS